MKTIKLTISNKDYEMLMRDPTVSFNKKPRRTTDKREAELRAAECFDYGFFELVVEPTEFDAED